MNLRFESTPVAPLPQVDAGTLLRTRAFMPDPDLRAACLAHGAATEQLDRLFTADALCVTTGQQPGLLTGPLLTIYKAVSAIALARRFEEILGRPVVPVFWVAGDDHDYAEANHVHLVDARNEIVRLALPDRPAEAPLTPLYREPVGETIDGILAAVVAATPATEFRDDVMAWLRRHYVPAHDLATAFAGAIAELLGPHGLVVFRPTHQNAKRAMSPHLVRALEHATELDRALGARGAELQSAGKPTPVHVGDGATMVMLECKMGRDRLVLDNGRFHARRSKERYGLDQLRALAEEEPQRFSPNVLLRPVIEAAILPTIAYVAGPSELAYFPQCTPLYERLEVVPQVPVARWSARAVEGRVGKVLHKYQLTAQDLDLPEGQLEQRLIRSHMPDEANGAIRVLRTALQSEYVRLRSAAVAIDPTLKRSVESAHHAALAGVKDVEKRILSHLKQKNEILIHQLAKARHNLFPAGKPQERVFNVVPYLIRYGRTFVDAVLQHAGEWMSALEPGSGKA